MRILPALTLALTLPVTGLADGHVAGRLAGNILSTDGDQIGSVSVVETASGVFLVSVQAVDIAAGAHGVHIHETGTCEGDFSSAGGHLEITSRHGLVLGGPHPGDLPNAFVGEDGELGMEAFAHDALTMTAMMDDDGSALIIHSGPDDYVSQPSGDAGERIACAVLDSVPAAAEN